MLWSNEFKADLIMIETGFFSPPFGSPPSQGGGGEEEEVSPPVCKESM